MKKYLRYKAYEDIKKKIIYFALKPGEKIIETEIAKKMKTSRTPVREALLMLESDGLVVCDPKIGFMVRKTISMEMNEYFAIQSIVDDFAIPLIIKNTTASQISALNKIIKKSEKSVELDDVKKISESSRPVSPDATG